MTDRHKLLPYKNFVLWGLRSNINDTFRYIHEHFYRMASELNLPVVWVDDLKENAHVIKKDPLVFCSNRSAKFLPAVKGAHYCLHNMDEIGSLHQELDDKGINNIRLQVFTNAALNRTEKWNETTFFNPQTKTLYQPWGTDLLPWNFLSPTKYRIPVVFWIGSIWNNDLDQGNLKEIETLRENLKKQAIFFKHIPGASDKLNIRLMRLSRFAPAVAGKWQVENNYLPCRLFKNVSYGQFAVTNVPYFKNIFGDSAIIETDISTLIEKAMSLNMREYTERIRYQQSRIINQGYITKLDNIIRALDGSK